MPSQRLVLLGGGHAHVQVVRAFGASPPPDTSVTLISESRLTPYSGMIPGWVAGHYRREEAHIDLAALCAAAKVGFVEGRAAALHLASRSVETAAGASRSYDILSVDTGSITPIHMLPGADVHAIAVKPVDRFVHTVVHLSDRVRAEDIRSIAVIGGGAAGFEIVLAIDHRLQGALAGDRRPAIHLCSATPTILPAFPPHARELAARILERRGITVHTGASVAAVEPSGVRLDDGRHLRADAVFVATGAAPSALYRQAGLRTDDQGFVEVHPTLQSVSHPEVFACGDVASVAAHPRPKAGVFAVRQGPPLAENLRRALRGTALRPFVPQREFLRLLSTGRKHAIAVRNGWSVQGDWVWRWKDRIDRRFVAGFAARAIRE